MRRWAVRWYEGMPLTPQHFQAADRYLLRQLDEAEDWSRPFAWGVRKLELAVDHSEVTLIACEARFPDGTKLTIPEDIEPRSLRVGFGEALKGTGSEAMVYLAIPERPSERHEFKEQPCDGEEGGEPILVEFRRPKAELIVVKGDGRPGGVRVLPLARIGGSPVAVLESYLPPLLAVDAWGPLVVRLGKLASDLHARVARLVEDRGDRPLTIEPEVPDDAVRVLKLLAFGGLDGHLQAVVSTPGLAPWHVFVELCRAAGQVAPFLPGRQAVKLPAYDHEDLAGCFQKVISLIDAALGEEEPPPFEDKPFRHHPHKGMIEVDVLADWFRDSANVLFLAVATELDAASCEALLERLDIATASRREVEQVHLDKTRGLRWERPKNLPAGLPRRKGQVFLTYDRADESDVLGEIRASRSLAIQFNPQEAAFRPGGVITIEDDRDRHDLQFSLYVLRTTR